MMLLEKQGEPVNQATFVCAFDKAAWKRALERDGCYILRAYMPVDEDGKQEWPAELENAGSDTKVRRLG